jgi:serine/threonine protein kinase
VGLAIDFMHSYGIVHRDIKPENILMSSSSSSGPQHSGHQPKLTDFGYCDRIGSDGYCENPLFCGTTDYMMYTTIDNQPCSYFVDVWSFGVTIFDLLVGYPPFHEQRHKDTYRRIRDCDVYWSVRDVYRNVKDCKGLLRRIFVPYPEDIPSMQEVLQDSWFF